MKRPSPTISRSRTRAAALQRRLANRASRQQVAMEAEVTDRSILERLGVTWGTAADGRIVMSKGDWTKVAASGGIRITGSAAVATISPATE